jgi:serine/threonine protein kinase
MGARQQFDVSGTETVATFLSQIAKAFPGAAALDFRGERVPAATAFPDIGCGSDERLVVTASEPALTGAPRLSLARVSRPDTFEDYDFESEPVLGDRRLAVYRDRAGARVILKEGLHRPSDELLSALCECDHPGIVYSYEVRAHDRSAFLLAEPFQANGSLETLFSSVFQGEQRDFWFPTWITRAALNIGFALSFLHSRGYFHGSLNPSHLLFDESHHLR